MDFSLCRPACFEVNVCLPLLQLRSLPVLYPEIHERYQVINPFIIIIGSVFAFNYSSLHLGIPILSPDTGR